VWGGWGEAVGSGEGEVGGCVEVVF